MKNIVKKNRGFATLLTVLYVAYVVCLFWFHPIVASAAGTDSDTKKVPGGKGNTVSVDSLYIRNDGHKFHTVETLEAKDTYEIIGYLSNESSYYRLVLCAFKDADSFNHVQKGALEDCTGFFIHSDKNGNPLSQNAISADNVDTFLYYKNISLEGASMTCSVSGCKIFMDNEAAKAYVETGSLDGMLRDIDDGELDKEIGYLHDLQHFPLMYGEELENGLYSSYDDRFTWSDYYPEYDDSYLVEVRASCEVEVKKWFGIGKSTVYNSDIRELARDVKYKDLEFIISLADERSVFSDFLNQYMPDNSSVSDVISAGTYQFDAYYFRIYKWDEEAKTYKYGLWVRLTKNGSALTGSFDETIDAGDFDDDGNFKPDPGSDYGDGKPGIAIPGAGEDQDSAKDDADKNKEDREDENKQIDLSNTNFKELWEWFTGLLLTFWNGLGVIPDFFGRIFSFLPAPVIGAIGFAIVAAIILRIIGR